VVDSNGDLAPGAVITSIYCKRLAVAGPDGKFRIPGIVFYEEIVASSPGGGASGIHKAAPMKPADPLETLVLRNAGMALRGVVTDPDGKAVAGCVVEARLDAEEVNTTKRRAMKSTRPRRQIQKTDNAGEFAFDDLPAGPVTLCARAPGFAFTSTKVTIRADAPITCSIALERGCVVEGAALDRDGAPMPNVVIRADPDLLDLRIYDTDEYLRGTIETTTAMTDARGRYRLTGVASGQSKLTATSRPPGASLGLPAAASAKITIAIRPGTPFIWDPFHAAAALTFETALKTIFSK
jgi:protocatechuate 3,4-dioxygenase beta subunit